MSADLLTQTASGEHAVARMRAAGPADVGALKALYGHARPQEPEAEAALREGLEQGGVLVLEDASGSLLAAVRWRETPQGWWLEPIVTLPVCGPECARWLLTKVEALAIQRNIPRLYMQLDADSQALLRDYRRLGYVLNEGCPPTLSKRVGGVWQYKAAERGMHDDDM